MGMPLEPVGDRGNTSESPEARAQRSVPASLSSEPPVLFVVRSQKVNRGRDQIKVGGLDNCAVQEPVLPNAQNFGIGIGLPKAEQDRSLFVGSLLGFAENILSSAFPRANCLGGLQDLQFVRFEEQSPPCSD